MVSDGGGLSAVERSGDTMRRRAGEWTPAVHALLGYLHAVGFAAATRPLGLSDGVEILAFVPGGAATHTDDELVRVGALIPAFHEATRSFVAPEDARWQFMVGAPFIDWDLAAPAPPLWDVAVCCTTPRARGGDGPTRLARGMGGHARRAVATLRHVEAKRTVWQDAL
jgi:Ser/Thr protein kinase RdoA (MazF antagonist)